MKLWIDEDLSPSLVEVAHWNGASCEVALISRLVRVRSTLRGYGQGNRCGQARLMLGTCFAAVGRYRIAPVAWGTDVRS